MHSPNTFYNRCCCQRAQDLMFTNGKTTQNCRVWRRVDHGHTEPLPAIIYFYIKSTDHIANIPINVLQTISVAYIASTRERETWLPITHISVCLDLAVVNPQVLLFWLERVATLHLSSRSMASITNTTRAFHSLESRENLKEARYMISARRQAISAEATIRTRLISTDWQKHATKTT